MSKTKSKETNTTKNCFFITPIGKNDSPEHKKLTGIMNNILEPVLKSKDYKLEVAHTMDTPGSINDQIFTSIIESELVIVNLSGLNANVMYEVAVRHSFGKPCIMICENGTNLPFDLIADRTIFFDDSIEGSGILKDEILKKIVHLEQDGTHDNPVYRALKKTAIRSESQENSGTNVLIDMLEDLTIRVMNIEGASKQSYSSKNDKKNKSKKYISNSSYNTNSSHISEILRVAKYLRMDLGRKPEISEIAVELDVPIGYIMDVLAISNFEDFVDIDLSSAENYLY